MMGKIKVIGIFVFILGVLLLPSLVFAAVNPKIELQGYSLSENPLMSGHIVNLTLNLKEIEWDYCADQVSVQLSLSYPLSINGPDTKYLGQLCANDTDRGNVTFTLPVDPLAQSGTYQITVSTKYQKRFDKLSETNILNVRVGGSPSFVATVTNSNPLDIYPGDSGTITISLQNNGSSTVKSAQAILSAPPELDVKWAGRTQTIGTIAPRASVSATFNIEVPKNTKPGGYPLDLLLGYQSEDDSNNNASFTFILPVKRKAEFNVSADEKITNDENKEIVLTVTNTGYDEAKNVKIKIKPIFPFSTDGTVRFIDSIKSGESKNVTYVIHVDKDATYGDQILTLLFDFESKEGKKFSSSADFSLTVAKRTLEQEVINYWYVVVFFVLIVVMIINRKLKKK